MAGTGGDGWLGWLKLRSWRARRSQQGRRGTGPVTEVDAARDLIAAIDAGGVPLNPARVNAIARALGLDVSVRAPVEETIGRIRAALSRLGSDP